MNAEKHKPNTKIFVGNLNPETSNEDILSNFQRFGTILGIDRKKEKEYALIEFDNQDSAYNAINEMDKIEIDDTEIKVQPAWTVVKKQTFGETINKLVEKGIVKNNA